MLTPLDLVVLVVYAVGIPVQVLVTGATAAVAKALVFVPGDVAKAVVATMVAAAVHRGYPVTQPTRRDEREGAVR